jgi:hypothetical protein
MIMRFVEAEEDRDGLYGTGGKRRARSSLVLLHVEGGYAIGFGGKSRSCFMRVWTTARSWDIPAPLQGLRATRRCRWRPSSASSLTHSQEAQDAACRNG